jgi:hypothetical protein
MATRAAISHPQAREHWRRQPSPEQLIDRGSEGLICSWADTNLRSNHDHSNNS